MKSYKRLLSFAAAAALTVSTAASWGSASVSAEDSVLYINEVCTGNNGENGNITYAADTSGEYCDWIELYNPSGSDVNLSGWKLIKDGSSEYSFGDVTVAAGEYKIVFCCKKYAGDSSYPNAGYNLSGDGVTLALNNGAEDIDTIEVPALAKDTCYARQPDATDNLAVVYPTPGASNNDAESAVPCNAPKFSAESGMYSSQFGLSLSTDEGNTIYYTTDGSDPATSTTRKEYTSEITVKNRSSEQAILATFVKVSEITPWNNSNSFPSNSAVDKGTVIRACTLSSAGKYSDTVTKSYFVGVSSKNHNNLPIISVTTDTANLFDYDTGIYIKGKTYYDYIKGGNVNWDNPEANYNQRGREWERECHIDFFEPDGTLALSQDCGMRTQGAYSRASYQKSFRFYARDEYGEKNFKYEFFKGLTKENGSGEAVKKFKKLVIRNGGNDCDYTKFKDSYLQSLVSDRSFDTQAGRPCVLFIDGEYWGLYTLQEDYDDSYFEENYDVDKDEVIVYKKGEIDEGLEEDIVYADELYNFAKNNNMSNAANYEKISQMLDIDSFIDYMATEIYIINEDWPGNNYAMWRVRNTDESNPYSDGRWRMLYYDTEMGVDHYGNSSTKYNINNLQKIMNNKSDFLPVIFNSLMKNSSFKEKFVTSMMDQMNVNYNWSRCQELMKPFYDAYFPELTKYFSRFPSWANVGNASTPCYNRMVTFLKNRPSYVPTMMKNSLGLGSAVSVNVTAVNSDGGTVKLNTSQLDLSKGFSGKYFTDYKITLTAEPKEGYIFKGWSGGISSQSKTISVSLSGNTNIQAVFDKEGESNIHTVTFKYGTKTYTSFVQDGGTASAPSGLFERTGYTLSWDKPLTNIRSDITVNAVYTGIKYTVKYTPNGGTGSSYTQSFTYGKAQALTACRFTRSGYIFTGWAKSSAADISYADKQTVNNLSSSANKTIYLYAKWKKSIPSCTVSGIGTKVYTGKAITQPITVKYGSTVLKAGTDYTVSYTNNTAIGTATVRITGKGNYGGIKTIQFKIKPATVTGLTCSRSVKSVRIKWNAVKGADKYQVYKKQSNGEYKLLAEVKALEYKETGMKSGQLCDYKVRAKTNGVVGTCGRYITATKTVTPVLKGTAGTKSAALSWTRCTDSEGYQIVMSASKNGKYTAIKYPNPNKITSYKKSGLTKGKTYYFKIRSFKTVNGKKLYSDYSSTVAVKAK